MSSGPQHMQTHRCLDIINGDDLKSHAKVDKERELQRLLSTGLPLQLDAEMTEAADTTSPPPALPFSAPFSPMVLELVHVTKRSAPAALLFLKR
eukprot:scaffold160889_cov31-Prasinocladus_malaysianus.AAC.1